MDLFFAFLIAILFLGALAIGAYKLMDVAVQTVLRRLRRTSLS